MYEEPKLFMILLGARPKGRFTEQHDIFFGIANRLEDLVEEIIASWPETKGKLHVDAWRLVTAVNGRAIKILPASAPETLLTNKSNLFFVNLGGYKEGEFDEFHYKILVVAPGMESAKAASKKTSFFKHYNLKKSVQHPQATAHIDDKYGIDVDDIYAVTEILDKKYKSNYKVSIGEVTGLPDDDMHLGYLKISDLLQLRTGANF